MFFQGAMAVGGIENAWQVASAGGRTQIYEYFPFEPIETSFDQSHFSPSVSDQILISPIRFGRCLLDQPFIFSLLATTSPFCNGHVPNIHCQKLCCTRPFRSYHCQS